MRHAVLAAPSLRACCVVPVGAAPSDPPPSAPALQLPAKAWASVLGNGDSATPPPTAAALADAREVRATAAETLGERWEEKKARIRRKSRFGKASGWDLRSVIVKSGDDCRQEHLAAQLVAHFAGQRPASTPRRWAEQETAGRSVPARNSVFRLLFLLWAGPLVWGRARAGQTAAAAAGRPPGLGLTRAVAGGADIYAEAGLPLWLRPYEVLVTSSRTALIETITDAISIHAVKSRSATCANGGSLRDHFHAKYGRDTPAHHTAQVRGAPSLLLEAVCPEARGRHGPAAAVWPVSVCAAQGLCCADPWLCGVQRNFVESMAGYSILSYLLQVSLHPPPHARPTLRPA